MEASIQDFKLVAVKKNGCAGACKQEPGDITEKGDTRQRLRLRQKPAQTVYKILGTTSPVMPGGCPGDCCILKFKYNDGRFELSEIVNPNP